MRFRFLLSYLVVQQRGEVGTEVTRFEDGNLALEPVENLQAKRVFIGPMFINRRLADAGGFSDCVHAGAVDTSLGEEFLRRNQHLFVRAGAAYARHGLNLDTTKEVSAEPQKHHRDRADHGEIGCHAKVGNANKGSAESVNAICHRVEAGDDSQRLRQVGEGKQRAGQKEDWHDQEVHHELKSLHIDKQRADCRAERSEHRGDQRHE